MAILQCIGRTDSLGDRNEFGSHIGFVLQYPGGTRHTFVLEEPEAEELSSAIDIACFDRREG